jgi:DNA-directed RNA polymerase subunit RPC12/RpoP
MALKIRCTDCQKKISIDEAFAGGVCRCPYCTALVFVPEANGKASGLARPAAPAARPDAPPTGQAPAIAAPAAALAAAKTGGQDHIPMAQPVLLQGIVSIVLIAFLLLMVGVSIYLLLANRPPPLPVETYSSPVNPYVPAVAGPVVAGDVSIEPPVVYVIDAGGGMTGVFDFARLMTRISVGSLSADQKFTVLLCGEEANTPMGDGWHDGGEKGKADVVEFLGKVQDPSGVTNIPQALAAAVALRPRTIVLLANKPVDDAMEEAAKARSSGIRIVTVLLEGEQGRGAAAAESMKNLAGPGGAFKQFPFGKLQEWVADAPQ